MARWRAAAMAATGDDLLRPCSMQRLPRPGGSTCGGLSRTFCRPQEANRIALRSIEIDAEGAEMGGDGGVKEMGDDEKLGEYTFRLDGRVALLSHPDQPEQIP